MTDYEQSFMPDFYKCIITLLLASDHKCMACVRQFVRHAICIETITLQSEAFNLSVNELIKTFENPPPHQISINTGVLEVE